MKIIASLAVSALAQDGRGFNYGEFTDYDLPTDGFSGSYGFDDSYGGGFYDYGAFESVIAEAVAEAIAAEEVAADQLIDTGRETIAEAAAAEEIAADQLVESGRERPNNTEEEEDRYFFTTTTTTSTTTTTTTTTKVSTGNTCWKCDQMTFATCATSGEYEDCELGDS